MAIKRINSRSKGARGERELTQVLNKYGYKCRRGQQYSGASGDADIIGVEGLHIECKRVERLDLTKALDQAKRDARENETPAVMHRKNGEAWQVTLELCDFMKLWSKAQNNNSAEG